jgi:hypothetical protein
VEGVKSIFRVLLPLGVRTQSFLLLLQLRMEPALLIYLHSFGESRLGAGHSQTQIIPAYKESGTNEWVCDVCPDECAHAVASGVQTYIYKISK